MPFHTRGSVTAKLPWPQLTVLCIGHDAFPVGPYSKPIPADGDV